MRASVRRSGERSTRWSSSSSWRSLSESACAVYLEEYAGGAPSSQRSPGSTSATSLACRRSSTGCSDWRIFVSPCPAAAGRVCAGGLAISALVLPIVVITASEALRAVPYSIREGAFGVGATAWETTAATCCPPQPRASSPAWCCRWHEPPARPRRSSWSELRPDSCAPATSALGAVRASFTALPGRDLLLRPPARRRLPDSPRRRRSCCWCRAAHERRRHLAPEPIREEMVT